MANASDRTYNYSYDFRLQILALMLKPGWLSRYANLIKPNYFPNADERDVASMILKHRETYSGNLPTRADMLLDHPLDSALINSVFDLISVDLSRTETEVLEWAKDSSMRLALMESIDDLENGDLKIIRERVTKALQIGNDHTDLGLDLIKDAPEWMTDLRSSHYISTPWQEVNDILDGGLAPGELGLLMAPPGGMKSTGLVNIGTAAANHVNKANVIHFTLEMSEQKVLRRYAARLVNEMYTYNTDSIEYEAKLVEGAHKLMRGAIRVKRYPTNQATVNDLRDFIHKLQDNGFVPGMAIVDYPDLLRSSKGYGERRFELQNIYENLRGMFIEEDIPGWGATQANRSAFNKKIITMEEIAEDVGKANISDVIMAICQTKDEKDVNDARLYMAKVRDGDSAGRSQVKLKIRFPAMISSGYYSELTEGIVNDDDDDFGPKK